MTRRSMLTGAAASLTASITSHGASTLGRGLWRDEFGSFAIGELPEFGKGLFAFDYSAFQVGALSQGKDSSWAMAGTLDGSGVPISSIHASRTELRIGLRKLRPVPVQRTSFDVTAKSITLSCELAAPAGKRPRGTIFMIYGSGPAPKAAFDLWAFWFLASDFAVITYDKRGSGKSGGDWRLTGLETLAQDARSVLSRARRLGVTSPVIAWGASQAGWIEPQLGAARVIDGIVMHAGPAVRPREQMIQAMDAELRAYGFPADEIDRARSYYELDIDVSLGSRPWVEVRAEYNKASASGAEWLITPPAAADAPERTMIRLMACFDPAPYWRRNTVPVLAVYGGKDWVVPAIPNGAELEKAVSGNGELTLATLPSANHLMFIAQTGVRSEYPKLSRLDPAYFGVISRWLEARY